MWYQIICFQVKSYGEWYADYKALAATEQRADINSGTVLRDRNNHNQVVVLFEGVSLDERYLNQIKTYPGLVGVPVIYNVISPDEVAF